MFNTCAAPAIISFAVSGANCSFLLTGFFSCFEKAFVLSEVLISLRVVGVFVFTPSSGLTLALAPRSLTLPFMTLAKSVFAVSAAFTGVTEAG